MAGVLNESDDGDDDGFNDINVTPFIDVMLVLLIIFMVAAPLSTVDVAVDLPTSTAQVAKRPDKPLFLTLKADWSLLLGETRISATRLGDEIDAVTGHQRDTRIFVRADKIVPYGTLMGLLNQLRSTGYLKVSLVALEGPAADSPTPPDATGQSPRPQ